MQVRLPNTGWKKLDAILDSIEKAINQNEPLSGANITVDKTGAGTIIRAFSNDNGQSAQADNPASGSGGTTSSAALPTSVTLQDVSWYTVTVVDPNNNCAQSTVKLLQSKVGSQVTLAVTFS